VELIKNDSGKTTLHFIVILQIQSPLSSNIQIRSRKATSSDCSNFLWRGIDIPMLKLLDQFNPISISGIFFNYT